MTEGGLEERLEVLRERFCGSYSPEPNTGCWLWTKAVDNAGYGRCQSIGANAVTAAHRLSFILFKGPIADGHYICHKCDTPACVNPDHLFMGTQQDNVNDMMAKGRNRPARGTSHPFSKLSDDEVARMRNIHAAGGVSIRRLGRMFGVSHTTARFVVHRMTYKQD